LPVSRDYSNKHMYLENYRSKDIYRSNENFSKLNHYNSQERINHATASTAAKTTIESNKPTPKKYEEEKKN